MKCLPLIEMRFLVVCVVWILCVKHCAHAANFVKKTINVSIADESVQHLDKYFLSTTIDISLITHEDHCDFQSDQLKYLTSQLKPIRLRVGGTKGDKFYYNMSNTSNNNQDGSIKLPKGYSALWNQYFMNYVLDFVCSLNLSLVFGINAGLGPRYHTTSPQSYYNYKYDYYTQDTVGISNINKNINIKSKDEIKSWTNQNLITLLDYLFYDYNNSDNSSCKTSEIIYGFEFGNEPNLYPFKLNFSVSGQQYAKDVILFSKTIKNYSDTIKIITNDIDLVPELGEIWPFLDEFVSYFRKENIQLSSIIDIVTYHFYPLFALPDENDVKYPWYDDLIPFYAQPTAKVLIPSILDQVTSWFEYIERVYIYSNNSNSSSSNVSSISIWLGETGSAVGGGQFNLSNAFADGFEFYDKIGQLSLVKNKLIFRQTLCDHEPYSLINYQNNKTGNINQLQFTPNPSYYTFMLFKQLVNNNDFGKSLNVTKMMTNDNDDTESDSSKLRLYAFCGNQNNGSIVVMVINLSDTIEYCLSFDDQSIVSTNRMEYVFRSDSLESKHIYLNGKLLQLNQTNGNIPQMNGKYVNSDHDKNVKVSPLTYGLIVFVDVHFNACIADTIKEKV